MALMEGRDPRPSRPSRPSPHPQVLLGSSSDLASDPLPHQPYPSRNPRYLSDILIYFHSNYERARRRCNPIPRPCSLWSRTLRCRRASRACQPTWGESLRSPARPCHPFQRGTANGRLVSKMPEVGEREGTDHDDVVVLGESLGEEDGRPDGVGSLERRDDTLHLGTHPESSQRLLVRRGDVLGATSVLQPRVLGADSRVVETGGDRVRASDLSFRRLEDVGAYTVEDSLRPHREGRRVIRCVDS